MSNWESVEAAVPDLARRVRERFEATGLGMLATVRKDGSPRISGVEPTFRDGELWLGSMWEARKAHDLQRDPRFALHAATVDKEVKDGDARIAGRVVEITDEAVKKSWGEAAAEAGEFDPNPMGPWHLFRAEVTELSFIQPGGDHLVIEWWTPDQGARRIERH